MKYSKEEEMDKELYVAAMKGNVEFLRSGRNDKYYLRTISEKINIHIAIRNDEYYLRKTSEKNNIIHIAIRHEQYEFIQEALRKFPSNYYKLISEGNSKENTPLHIAAEVGNYNIVSLLYEHLKSVEGNNKEPLREPNSSGYTAVHVAIIHENVKIAKFLLGKDPYLARVVNNKSGEAPLHLAIKQHVNFSESESIIEKIRQPVTKGGAQLPIQSAPEENMSSLIKYLVEIESCVASWPDENGMTPLHRAASLSSPYNLEITRLMIEHWPQSAEVCDGSGNSILHLLISSSKIPNYQEGISLLELKDIYALRNHQDRHGNTPLHIAVKNKDATMVRVLLESSTKFNINNNDGLCATSVIEQEKVFQMLRQRDLTKEEFKAANKGNIGFMEEKLSKLGIDFLLSKDPKGKNILHKLMNMENKNTIIYEQFVNFINHVLETFPGLVCQTDQLGNTPLHILVQNKDATIFIIRSPNYDNIQQVNREKSLWHSGLLSDLLKTCNECILNNTGDAHHDDVSPWLVQNGDGNTPLHEAILATNKKLALELLDFEMRSDYHLRSVSVANRRKETPLHLLARSPTCMEPYVTKDIEKMVEANVGAAYVPDNEGLTPILRAFKAGNLATATMLCEICPIEAVEIFDTDGRTIWHLLIVQQSSGYFVHKLVQQKALRNLLHIKDEKGDTPLHLAITHNRFDIVQDFLETWEDEREKSKDKHHWIINLLKFLGKGLGKPQKDMRRHWLVDLFKIKNKVGKSPADLIAEAASLPLEVEKSIKYKHEMVGVRSVWGIPTTQMETYVNTIGIIAALLATITFTAAFTVPGGVSEDKGTPILLEKKTFQIFMISDVIALCLSMMTLVCLLKIMATNNKRHSVVILDFSITLLLASFYATIVTFMMGLFAALFSIKPWIVIVSTSLCSLLILLVIKFLFVKLFVPFKKIKLYLSWMLGRNVTKFLIACNLKSEKVETTRRTHNRPHPPPPV